MPAEVKEQTTQGAWSEADPVASWRDANALMNALTIGLLVCLVPARPFSAGQLSLTLASWAFVGTALVNHLFPQRLHWMTHVVKAAYTQLLFASVAPIAGLGGQWWLAAAAVSLLDLSPLATGPVPIGRLAEGVGATVRLGLVGWGFWLVRFPTWVVVVWLGCNAAYFFERRRRINRGRRYDYGWLHCFEHVAIFAYLYVLNGPRLDRPLVWDLAGGLFVALALGLVVLGVGINVRTWRSLERELPPWFDAGLRELILDKSRANARSHRWQHYVFKPFSPKMLNRRVSWRDIEEMVARIEVPAAFDAVVGITSGGAFIARCVAERLGVAEVHYVHSRLWSRLALHRNVVTSFRYYAGLVNGTRARFMDEGTDLTGKRVLLVDDSVCTGATLATVEGLCRARGAVHVETFALFANPEHPTDYHASLSKTPLVWPWGWESD